MSQTVNRTAVLALAFGMVACSNPKPDQSTARANPPASPGAEETSSSGSGGSGANEESSKTRDDDIRDGLLTLLGADDYQPDRDDFEQIAEADRLVPVLVDIYRDSSVSLYQRTRAVSALRFFSNDESRALLEEILENSDAEPAIRRIAVKAYGHAFGADAVPAVADLLDADDYHTRDAAVRTLVDIDTDAARRVLDDRLDEASSDEIKERIRSYLGDSGARSPDPTDESSPK